MPGSNPLNLGIEETQILGDYESAEAFLSGGEGIVTDDEGIEEVGKEKSKEKVDPKKATKKPIVKKVEVETEEEEEEEEEVDPLGEKVEDDEEDEEEEEGEGDKDTKKKKEEEEANEDDEEEETEEGKKAGKEKGNNFEQLAADLFRLGVFTQQEEEIEIKAGEDLLKRFQLQGQLNATSWLDNFLGRFGDDRKELFDAIFINGVNPKTYLPVYNQVEEMESLDLTNVDNQKSVFREFYKRAGLKPETIEKNLSKALDYGDLEDTITELHEQIVEQDKQSLEDQKIEEARVEANKKRADVEYKTNLQKVLGEKLKAREVKGIPITEQRVREVIDFLHTPKYKAANGQLLTDFDKFILESRKPENIENRIIIALLKMDNFDFSKIEKKGVSKETNELFTSLAQKVTKQKSRTAEKATAGKGSKYFKL